MPTSPRGNERANSLLVEQPRLFYVFLTRHQSYENTAIVLRNMRSPSLSSALRNVRPWIMSTTLNLASRFHVRERWKSAVCSALVHSFPMPLRFHCFLYFISVSVASRASREAAEMTQLLKENSRLQAATSTKAKAAPTLLRDLM